MRSAVEFAKAVAQFRPLWIEEPILRENPAGLGAVAAKSPVGIASGEGLLSRFEFRQLLEARGAAIIQPDVIHAGGVTEIRKIANLAERSISRNSRSGSRTRLAGGAPSSRNAFIKNFS